MAMVLLPQLTFFSQIPFPSSVSPFVHGARRRFVSPIMAQSADVYPSTPGIDPELFILGKDAIPQPRRQKALTQLRNYQNTQKSHFMGYQCNQEQHYSEDFAEYLDMMVNNIGDPFGSGNFTMNCKWMERAVLDYFAELWRATVPHKRHEGDTYWGYVLSMGSSEGVLYGMWNARDYLAGKKLMEEPTQGKGTRLMYQAPRHKLHAYTPIAFYSEDTHYSFTKCMTALGIQTFYEVGMASYPEECPLEEWKGKGWPTEVPSLDGNEGPGSIDIDALAKLVEFFSKEGYPILVNFNYGSTFKGAYDDVMAAGSKLMPIFEKYGLDNRVVEYETGEFDRRTGFWIHVDGALGAAYTPFIEMAFEKGKVKNRAPIFDFRLPYVHSINMSGHKWIGAPVPCGVYMTRTKYQILPPDNPEYIGSADTTFAGSRNGLSSMILWDYLSLHSYEQLITKALRNEEKATYTERRLLELEQELGIDLWVKRTPLSLTVRFRQANPDIVFKYSLSGETLIVDGVQRDYSHVYLMEHVTYDLINELVSDLSQEGAFETLPRPFVAKKIVTHPDPLINRLAFVPHHSRSYRG